MDTKAIVRYVCLAVTLVCIVVSALLAFAMVWSVVENDVAWRSLISLAVLIFATFAAEGAFEVFWYFDKRDK